MTDLILAIAHHLAVFTLVGLFAAEFALLRPGIGPDRLRQLARIDRTYGIVAGIVIIVGFSRVFFGASGPSFYFPNPVFWMKIGAFIIVGLLSIPPTMSILGWVRAAKGSDAYTLPVEKAERARRFLYAEAIVLLFIPMFAAAMARGYGL
jgi:putative membrane protein